MASLVKRTDSTSWTFSCEQDALDKADAEFMHLLAYFNGYRIGGGEWTVAEFYGDRAFSSAAVSLYGAADGTWLVFRKVTKEVRGWI